jgi:DnaJ domain
MSALFVGLLLAIIAAITATAYGRMPQVSLAALPWRPLAAGALCLVALWLLVQRQFGYAVGLIMAALGLLGPAGFRRAARPSPGQRSEVSSDGLAMTLDHDTGEMDGEVLTGRFQGRRLSDLGPEELQALLDEFEHDADSTRLLLAYLDRRRGAAGAGADEAGAPDPDAPMREEDAYRVLGLKPGASHEEIRAAYRRLIKKVHPDLGGSAALAAMINAAKQRLDPD